MDLMNKKYKENIKLIDGTNRKIIINLYDGAIFSMEAGHSTTKKHCFFKDPNGTLLMTAPSGQIVVNGTIHILPPDKKEVVITSTCIITSQKNVIKAASNYFSLFFNYNLIETSGTTTPFVINSHTINILNFSSKLPEINCNFSHN